jgi:hypothetical protein
LEYLGGPSRIPDNALLDALEERQVIGSASILVQLDRIGFELSPNDVIDLQTKLTASRLMPGFASHQAVVRVCFPAAMSRPIYLRPLVYLK